jgi:hypothetical protein
MDCINKISHVFVRFINKTDGKIEVKVYIKNHFYREANLRIDQQDLIDAGAMKNKGALIKAENWMNKNKEFVLKQINKQFPSFWETEFYI